MVAVPSRPRCCNCLLCPRALPWRRMAILLKISNLTTEQCGDAVGLFVPKPGSKARVVGHLTADLPRLSASVRRSLPWLEAIVTQLVTHADPWTGGIGSSRLLRESYPDRVTGLPIDDTAALVDAARDSAGRGQVVYLTDLQGRRISRDRARSGRSSRNRGYGGAGRCC